MLFHLGALWRLNQAGYLQRLERVSSVSGGSITAATLGLAIFGALRNARDPPQKLMGTFYFDPADIPAAEPVPDLSE